jgi:hypothetical protein
LGLLNRLRQRIDRRLHPPAPKAGPVWTEQMEKEWEDLPEQVDAALKKLGSAAVGTWEVGAADLGRVLIGQPQERSLMERYSDGLVPTLEPYQELHRRCAGQMQRALVAARAGGLPALEPEFTGILEGLSGRVDEGWDKTVTWLAPLIALSGHPAELERELRTRGGQLRESAQVNEQKLRERLRVLPQENLYENLCEVWEEYQQDMCRDIEVILDSATQMLVGALRQKLRG